MITAQQLEVRAGARLLMEQVSFRVAAGDKVGLVGRNGAGKTTLTRILAGQALDVAERVDEPRVTAAGHHDQPSDASPTPVRPLSAESSMTS